MATPRCRRFRVVAVRTALGALLVAAQLGAAAAGAQPLLAAAPPPPPPPTAGTDQAIPYEYAVNAFKYQDFDNAVPLLRQLVYPTSRLDQQREWRVREYLGAALWWQGETKAALDEFTALLARNPQARLDPALYPPKMIADFEGLRQNLLRLGVITADQGPRAPELNREPAPFGLMLFPFGVGQFANRDHVKGAVLLAAETILASVSIVAYTINRDDGLRTGSKSKSTEIMQFSTGGAFWLLAGWGVWDAIQRRRAHDVPLPR